METLYKNESIVRNPFTIYEIIVILLTLFYVELILFVSIITSRK